MAARIQRHPRPSSVAQLTGESCIAARNATKCADLHIIDHGNVASKNSKSTTWGGCDQIDCMGREFPTRRVGVK
eukprot:6175648-Pleurochrysis_carterae.AAC.1